MALVSKVTYFLWFTLEGKGMGTEWDKEVVGKVGPQKRVLCLAQVFLRVELPLLMEFKFLYLLSDLF